MTKIGFDLDGVLYDWHKVIYEWVKDYSTDFDVSYSEFWLDWIQKEERKKLANFLCKTPIFVTNLIMSESLRKMLWSLALENELFYITSRPKEVRFGTEWWIKTSRIPNPENLIFAFDSKLPYIIDNEIDYFVEDMTKHAIALRDHTQVILISKPWNTIIQGEFPTISDVSQLPELLEELKYETSINIKD
jgi:uncharacterized HAD superfamily protein